VNEADVLFLALPGRLDRSPGSRISAKTYEYLATDRPILAAVPRGENWDFLEPHPGVWCVEPNDVAAMVEALREIGAAIKNGGGWAAFNRESLAEALSYDRRVEELEAVLANAIERGGTAAAAQS
jgi:glycosyltransferase involved in cell wall biosynthesis